MKYIYFKLSAISPEADAERLNAFLASHAIVSVSEQFVADGQNSFWSVRVAIAENSAQKNGSTSSAKRGSVDYREILTPEAFAVYAKLRTLRNQIAEQQAIPAYAVFTNEQLAEMAKMEHPSKASISQIEGIGEKRMSLYADQFLVMLLDRNG